MKYKTIYTDPPWPQQSGGIKGAANYYTTMSVDSIALMGDWVKEIADPRSHLYMWTVSNFLPEALQVIEDWGFRYVTNLAWVKDKIGLGYYFRTKHELLLFGVRGKPRKPKEMSAIESIIHAPRLEHSAKPHEFYELIERASPGPYLEIFARNKREGWHSWGNELVTADGRTGQDACDITEDYGFWRPPLQKAA